MTWLSSAVQELYYALYLRVFWCSICGSNKSPKKYEIENLPGNFSLLASSLTVYFDNTSGRSKWNVILRNPIASHCVHRSPDPDLGTKMGTKWGQKRGQDSRVILGRLRTIIQYGSIREDNRFLSWWHSKIFVSGSAYLICRGQITLGSGLASIAQKSPIRKHLMGSQKREFSISHPRMCKAQEQLLRLIF